MAKKRQRRNRRDREGPRDRLSELPDCVLLHIIQFMDTKSVVQTCILSKRWKHLWKYLTTLAFNSLFFNNVNNFTKFVSRVLSGRDDSISVHNVEFIRCGDAQSQPLNRLMKYVVLHNVQQLTISTTLNSKPSTVFRPYIFSCQSLTFLKVSINSCDPSIIVLPESLNMSTIRSLHLECCTFTASDRDYAEPFSTCHKLDSLTVEFCALQNGVKFLTVSNKNLSKLTVRGRIKISFFQIELSTPNLRSLTVLGQNSHPSFTSCNLSLVEELTIETFGSKCSERTELLIISWL